jgi:FHA domain-containing protein
VRAQERAVLGLDVTAAELRALVSAARHPHPFLFFRDGAGTQQVVVLDRDRAVLGRAPGSDLEVPWDPRVSGVHAYFERRGPRWVVEDDGMSRNGTFVNGARVQGQRALSDGDVIQVGDTLLGFRDPGPRVPATVTVPTVNVPEISAAQRRILVALCRPVIDHESSLPATNEQIARELVLSLPTVKGHLRVLFARFGLEAATQNQKRRLLAERALATGLVQRD